MKALLALCLLPAAALAQEPNPFGIPIVDLSGEMHRQTVVDREPGQYLGHPSTLLLSDGRTILVAYPQGHGKGPILFKKSPDGGRTWGERLPTPENWATSRETPTLYRLIDPHGKPRILLFSGRPGLVRIAYSEDEGETWSPLEPIRTPGPAFGGIVAMSSVVRLRDGSYMALFHDDGRWLRDPPEHPDGKHFRVFKSVSSDGGLSWSQPEVIAEDDRVHLCEPGAIRSPNGKTIAVLLRENSRTRRSFVIFSDDEGLSWTQARELPAALTGDRHTAKYSDDGRLFITFRDNGISDSPTRSDWVGWVGSWDDLASGAPGEYRVRLMDNHKGYDTAYPGLELLPDGTFVTTTYGHWTPGEEPYVVSVRFRLQELDARAAFPAEQGLTSLIAGTDETFAAPAGERPNILFVSFDDLNDWALAKDSPLHMPNLEGLSRRAAFFERAYTASPACNPSRVALLLGMRPTTTGVYGNRSDWRRALPDAVTLPRAFLEAGYRVEGAGKVFHHHDNSAFHDAPSFHRFMKMQLDPIPLRKFNGIDAVRSRNYDWGPWPLDAAETPDARTAAYAEEFLSRSHQRPFFLAVGLFRPHMPFHAPPQAFAHYPPDQMLMPKRPADDLDDIPSGGKALLAETQHFWDALLGAEADRPGTWRESVRAYQASATFADQQLGRVLDALGRSPYADNTVVVVWSDHGYHLGEKEHWEKFALWEKTTRVPLLILAPGVTRSAQRVAAPVSLLDLYPTLLELTGLAPRPDLEGESLVPLLRDPIAGRESPALMTWGPGNHAVRSERWRYIRYADGSEELYDHAVDPNEWRNVAARRPDVIRDLARSLPMREAAPVASTPRR